MASSRTERRCRYCFSQIPDDRPKSMYCKDAHRVAWAKKQKRLRAKGGALVKEPVHVVKLKKLLFNDDDTELANFVRETFRAEVRDEITAHIRDNLLGMTEKLVDMAPAAVAALHDDLASEDDYVRSRAYALYFKYIAPIQRAAEEKDLDETGPVVIQINTPFSRRFDETVEANTERRETIDVSDWGTCYKCGTLCHPDRLRKHDTHGETTRWVCTTCYAKKKWRQSRALEPTLPDEYE